MVRNILKQQVDSILSQLGSDDELVYLMIILQMGLFLLFKNTKKMITG